MIILFCCLIFFNCELIFAELSVFKSFKTLFVREVKQDTIDGSFYDKVYLGSNVKIPCFGKREPPKNVKKYSWEHLEKVISNGNRYAIDDDDGTLTIYDVSIDDMGIFFCTSFTRSSSKKFKHTVKVIQIPSSGLKITFVYSIKLCNDESKAIAKRFVELKLKDNICGNVECKIVSIESICQNEPLPIPSLRVTAYIVIPAIPNGNCSPDCTRSNMKNLVEKVTKETVETIMKGDALKLPDEEEDLAISYYDSKEHTVCDPGFEMQEIASKTLCIPCNPGYYLNKGHCIPCYLNNYSEIFAATDCRHCGKMRRTSKRAATSKEDCHFSGSKNFVVSILIVLPLLIFIPCVFWLVRHYARKSTLYSFIDKCSLRVKKRKLENVLQSVVSLSESEPGREEKSTSIIAFEEPDKVKEDCTMNKAIQKFKEVGKTYDMKSVIPPSRARPTDSMIKPAIRNLKAQDATPEYYRQRMF